MRQGHQTVSRQLNARSPGKAKKVGRVIRGRRCDFCLEVAGRALLEKMVLESRIEGQMRADERGRSCRGRAQHKQTQGDRKAQDGGGLPYHSFSARGSTDTVGRVSLC